MSADNQPDLGELIGRIEAARARLDALEDPDDAVGILEEMSELAKELVAGLEQERRAAETNVADG